MNYIVYDKDGKIRRTIICPPSHCLSQAKDGEFVMEGTANDVTQKIKNPGIAGVIIDKTPEEIEAEKPPKIPFEKRIAHITNKQWQNVLRRIKALEEGQ